MWNITSIDSSGSSTLDESDWLANVMILTPDIHEKLVLIGKGSKSNMKHST